MARTREHIRKLAAEHDWEEIYHDFQIVEYGRGAGPARVVVRVRFGRTGAIVHASRRQVGTGFNEHPTRGKQTAVRQWLAGSQPGDGDVR